jgi:hypothetical protein
MTRGCPLAQLHAHTPRGQAGSQLEWLTLLQCLLTQVMIRCCGAGGSCEHVSCLPADSLTSVLLKLAPYTPVTPLFVLGHPRLVLLHTQHTVWRNLVVALASERHRSNPYLLQGFKSKRSLEVVMFTRKKPTRLLSS